ncbi:MAG: hypothetical protein AB7H96_23415 [Vicinamibacterales bacterium]
MKRTVAVCVWLCLVTAVVGLSGCTSSQPVAPTGTAPVARTVEESSNRAGALKASAPQALSPVNSHRFERNVSVVLRAGAASPTYADSTAFRYRFEVYDRDGRVVQSSGPSSALTWTVTAPLVDDSPYTWRVRAEFEDAVTPWSSAGSFLTPQPPPLPCGQVSDPAGILNCWANLAFDDHPGPGELNDFLQGVAVDFNRVGIPSPAGSPWGMLRKVGNNNNCNGWSCDILCTGQGSQQRQFDVLLDERTPRWGSAIREMRLDTCVAPTSYPNLED